MLMSHSIRPKDAYIRYRVKVVTGKRLTAVRPFWLRANGCGKQVSYPCPAAARRARPAARSSPGACRSTAGSSPSAATSTAARRTCGSRSPAASNRRLLDTAPRYGMPNHLYYRARPILHEPGPIDTRYFLSRTGIPVQRGRAIASPARTRARARTRG